MVGISKSTLFSWLRQGLIPEPKRQMLGGIDVRLWSERDVNRVRRYKEGNFRKGRGRKKQA